MKHGSEIPVFFIVGRERSGTTLLQLMLDNHPNITVPTESAFISQLHAKYGKVTTFRQDVIDAYIDDLFDDPYIRLWKITRQDVKEQVDKIRPFSYAELCRAVMLSSRSSITKNMIMLLGDKNPVHSLHIPLLKKIFPGAKFIFVSRDPRDQVRSMMNVNFERKDPVVQAYRWRYFNKKILNDLSEEKHLHVRYEDLVESPQEELKKICSFLDIAYDPVMLATGDQANKLLEDGRLIRDHHASLTVNVNAGNRFRWRTEMNEDERKLVEQYTADVASSLGYETEIKDYSVSPRHYLRILYAHGLFVYIDLMMKLPYGIRKFLFRKLISRTFTFWKESAKKLRSSESLQNR